MKFPTHRLYQHPVSSASIAIERPCGEENAVFFLHLDSPETRALIDIDQRIKWFKDRPLGSTGVVRRQLRVSRLPRLLRRSLWWAGLNVSGKLRSRMFGTFGVSTYSSLGSATLAPVGFLTSTLSYGVISREGDVTVRVSYDHRTLDGADVARALTSLESFLRHEILAELRYLERVETIQSAA
jgi:hypothetical protein